MGLLLHALVCYSCESAVGLTGGLIRLSSSNKELLAEININIYLKNNKKHKSHILSLCWIGNISNSRIVKVIYNTE